MAYVAPTPAQLKVSYPIFSAVADPVIQDALDEAAGRVDTTWLERDFARAQLLFACHVLTLNGQGTSREVQLLGFKRIKVGPLELERSASSTAEAGSLASTSFGVRFAELLSLNFAGPMTT